MAGAGRRLRGLLGWGGGFSLRAEGAAGGFRWPGGGGAAGRVAVRRGARPPQPRAAKLSCKAELLSLNSTISLTTVQISSF